MAMNDDILNKYLFAKQKEEEEQMDIPMDIEQPEIAQAQEAMVMPELAALDEEAQVQEINDIVEADNAPKDAERSIASEAPSDRESMLQEYRDLIDQYKKDSSQKSEMSTGDKVMDWLTAAGQIASNIQDPNLPTIQAPELWSQTKKKQQESSKKDSLDKVSGLQKLIKDYLSVSKPDKSTGMTAYQKERLDLDKKKFAAKDKKESTSPIEKHKAKTQVKQIETAMDTIDSSATQMQSLDDALNATINYEKNSAIGTGPVAQYLGSNPLFSEEAQALDAKYKKLALDNMAKIFSGMSKAVDSDAERKFFEQSQASLSNRAPVNAEILLGAKAVNLRATKEAEAKTRYFESNGTLDGFKSPLKNTKVFVDASTGEMVLVDKDKISEAKKSNLMEIDAYAKRVVKTGKPEKAESQGVLLRAPDGSVMRVKQESVQKYLDKGATIVGE